MASPRRKYTQLVAEGPHREEPVASTPVQAAEPPPPVETPKPVEPPTTETPVDKAAKEAVALQLRLREMEAAENLQRQVVQEQARLATEPPPEPQEPTLEQAIAHLPPRVQRWYREHPELATDPEKAAQVQYCHHVARREVGSEFNEPYFDRMESMLGFAPATNGQVQHRPVAPPPAAPAPAPRASAPVRQHAGPPVSAPPTREAPSMSTGRAYNSRRPLSADEKQIASSMIDGVRITSQAAAEKEYMDQRDRMDKMKAAGIIQNG